MAAIFDPSIPGVLLFGVIAGICPCNIAIALGLIGYLTSDKVSLSPATMLKLVFAFTAGSIIIFLPLGFLSGIAGRYVLFLDETIALIAGGVLMILMGLQLLRVYQLPIKNVYSRFKEPESFTIAGTFFIGLSFGAITVGRAAPMLLVVLTYIALYQTPVTGFFTILLFSIGLSVPLIVISSTGGILGKKIRELLRVSGSLTDRIVGLCLVLIGIYFFYQAAA